MKECEKVSNLIPLRRSPLVPGIDPIKGPHVSIFVTVPKRNAQNINCSHYESTFEQRPEGLSTSCAGEPHRDKHPLIEFVIDVCVQDFLSMTTLHWWRAEKSS